MIITEIVRAMATGVLLGATLYGTILVFFAM